MEEDLFDISIGTMGKALRQSIHNTAWLDGWQAEVRELQQAKQAYHQKLEVLVRETKPEFLAPKKQALQAAFAEVLADHRQKYVQSVEPKIEGLKRSAKPAQPPNDIGAMMKYLQLQEVRGDIKAMEPLMLRAEYESRSMDTSGQYDLWLEAVETAPIPLLPGEVIDRGKESRSWRALDPKHREQLSDLQALKDASEYLIGLAAREIPPVDEIARMAAGTPEPLEAA